MAREAALCAQKSLQFHVLHHPTLPNLKLVKTSSLSRKQQEHIVRKSGKPMNVTAQPHTAEREVKGGKLACVGLPSSWMSPVRLGLLFTALPALALASFRSSTWDFPPVTPASMHPAQDCTHCTFPGLPSMPNKKAQECECSHSHHSNVVLSDTSHLFEVYKHEPPDWHVIPWSDWFVQRSQTIDAHIWQ